MASTPVVQLAERPAHVPADLMRDFDVYNVPGTQADIHAAFASVQQSAPSIFWTPRNGGHWVATRGDDIQEIQRDYRHFSHRDIAVPPSAPGSPRIIPIGIDPPLHTPYRRPLMQFLTPAAVAALDDRVRQVAIETIEPLEQARECEFVEDFANILPIVVFLSLVNVPLAEKDNLLQIVKEGIHSPTHEARAQNSRKMGMYLANWVMQRRAQPGEDLLSKVVNVEIDGERITDLDACIFAATVFFGGLDTVAGMMSFIALYLARNPAHRRQLAENLGDRKYLRRAVEELIRRHGLVNTARVVAEDIEFRGVQLMAGDYILPPSSLVGLDERLNPDPLNVDFERAKPLHAAFGNGPHACPGAGLARQELLVFLEEWLSRIPDFSIKPGTEPVIGNGPVNGVVSLDLVFS